MSVEDVRKEILHNHTSRQAEEIRVGMTATFGFEAMDSGTTEEGRGLCGDGGAREEECMIAPHTHAKEYGLGINFHLTCMILQLLQAALTVDFEECQTNSQSDEPNFLVVSSVELELRCSYTPRNAKTCGSACLKFEYGGSQHQLDEME